LFWLVNEVGIGVSPLQRLGLQRYANHSISKKSTNLKKMKIKILTLFLFFTVLAQAQDMFIDDPNRPRTDANIMGHVVDKNGEHLPFVTIAIKGTTLGAATDITGHYLLTNLPEGKFMVVISGIGYKRQEKEIFTKSGVTLEVNFELEPDVINLDQIVVTADRNTASRRDATVVVNVVSGKTFQMTHTENLTDGLVFTPGLRVENNCQNCGFNQVRLNGMEGPYSQILINSRPVFSGLAGVYGLELMPAGMIERVEVIRGGGSALYGGNAIAGVVNIITKEPKQSTFQVGANGKITGLGTESNKTAAGSDLFFNSGFTNFNNSTGIFIYGNKVNQQPWDANNDDFSEAMQKKGYSAGFSTYYKPNHKNKITLDYYTMNEFRRGGDGFDRSFHDTRTTESVTHDIQGGNVDFLSYLRNSNNTLNAYVAVQNVDRQSYYGAEYDTTAYGNTTSLSFNSGLQLTLRPEKHFIAPLIFTSGIDFTYSNMFDEKLTSVNSPDAGNAVVSNQISQTLGLFAQNEWMLGRFRLLLGGRLDRYGVKDKEHGTGDCGELVFVPRVNLLTDITEKIQSRLSFSTGYRAPQIFDEDLHILTSGARTIIHSNDPDLTTEKSYSLSGSFDYTGAISNAPFYFLTEGFYTRLRNPFTNELSEPDEHGVVNSVRINAESGAVVAGVNLEAKLALFNKIDLQTGFTFQQSRFDENQQWGEDTLSLSRQIVRTPQQYGFMTLNYKPTHHLTTSLTGTYTGPMHVPHLAGGMGTNGLEIETEELVKTPSFFDLGFKVAHLFDIGSDMHMELSVGVKNLLNSYQRDFDRGINRDAGYIYGPKNPRTVYFGIKIGLF
jgi:outer membrane receptor for ferrienterochelin and colicins